MVRTLRWAVVLGAVAAASLAGCASRGPIEGADLAKLKADVRAASNEAVTLVRVGPRALAAGGNEALVVMPFENHGTKVADFTLYDGYFKVAFALVEELRDLGIRATVNPKLWAARAESVAFEQRTLDDKTVEINLAHVGAYEEIEQIYRLDPVEKRKLLISRTVLLAARSA